jgi:hypothetical protein
MHVLDALFDHSHQISSNVEIIGKLVQCSVFRQLMSESWVKSVEITMLAPGLFYPQKRKLTNYVARWFDHPTSHRPERNPRTAALKA